MNYIKKILKKIIPISFLEKLNTEVYSIDKFIEFASNEIPTNALVLDAGAGSCPYKKYFKSHNYESTDFENIFEAEYKNKHDFICSLDNIPKSNSYYDAVINTQVLEHVENPQLVINEMYRILKPGGKLFLTAPQGWGVHGAPYHFFNFTNYGLELLLKKSGFNIIFIKPRGGIFWYLSNRISILPDYILNQYPFSNKETKSHSLLGFFVFCLYVLLYPLLKILIPFCFFYLDCLDKKSDFTLGYSCYCKKNNL